jgi:hypothetical protein
MSASIYRFSENEVKIRLVIEQKTGGFPVNLWSQSAGNQLFAPGEIRTPNLLIHSLKRRMFGSRGLPHEKISALIPPFLRRSPTVGAAGAP